MFGVSTTKRTCYWLCKGSLSAENQHKWPLCSTTSEIATTTVHVIKKLIIILCASLLACGEDTLYLCRNEFTPQNPNLVSSSDKYGMIMIDRIWVNSREVAVTLKIVASIEDSWEAKVYQRSWIFCWNPRPLPFSVPSLSSYTWSYMYGCD